MQDETLIEYRGRRYILLWVGRTDQGERALLTFPVGTKKKTFWVDVDKLEVVRRASMSGRK